MSKLTNKQKIFCSEYVANGKKCAKKAAIAAGYSEKTAAMIGYENLNKPYIVEEIERLLEPVFKKNELKIEDIINEMQKVAFSNEFTLEGFEKLTVTDKLKALVELAKISGGYNQDESSKTIINVNLGDKKD
tara:strand:- start:261 stop:656 length:396 start_codon:yes stop_codon:yes gene_type:complete